MAQTSGTSSISRNSVKFSRNERYVPQLFDKKQQNNNSSNHKKEEPTKEEFHKSNFVDRSAQLNASLNSLAISNMINLKRIEKSQKLKINDFIDKKSEINSDNFNPFAKFTKKD